MARRKERKEYSYNRQSLRYKNRLKALRFRNKKDQHTSKQEDLSGQNASCETLITVVDSHQEGEDSTTYNSNDSTAEDAAFLAQHYLDQNMSDHSMSDHGFVTGLEDIHSSTFNYHRPDQNTSFKVGTEDPDANVCKMCGRATSQDLTSYHFLAPPLVDDTWVCRCDLERYGKMCNMSSRRRTTFAEKRFECAHCGHRRTKKKYILSHILACHLGEKPYACDLCEFRTALKHCLYKHSRIHTGVKRFSCDICNFESVHASSLQLHKKGHIGEKPFACVFCEFRTAYRQGLIKHMSIHTGNRIRKFPCTECGYIARDRNKLRRHQRIHTGEKPFPCTLCTYRTNQKSNLTVHMKVHGFVKPKKEAPVLPSVGSQN